MKAGNSVPASITITYTDDVTGNEVIQIFGTLDSSMARPLKELKAFKKTHPKPSESTTANFTLDQCAFLFYDLFLSSKN